MSIQSFDRVYAGDIYKGERVLFANSVWRPTSSIRHSQNGTFSIVFRGTNGDVLYCDPGDGSGVQVKTLLGTSTDVTFSYTNDGTERVVRIWGALNSVTYLNIYQQAVSSNLSELSKFRNLTYLRLTSSTFVGSIEALSGLLDLTWLSIQTTDVVGDLAALSSLSLLDECYAGYNPLTFATPTTFPAWDGVTYRFNDCSLSAAEVDRFLISLADSGMNNCSLYLDGNNQARTSASDSAMATLLGNSCTVTVNE